MTEALVTTTFASDSETLSHTHIHTHTLSLHLSLSPALATLKPHVAGSYATPNENAPAGQAEAMEMEAPGEMTEEILQKVSEKVCGGMM